MESDTIRRAERGRIVYFNAEEFEAPQIEDIPLDAQVLAGGLVTARTFDRGADGGKRHASGAVYDGRGHLLPEYVERDDLARDRFTSALNPAILDGSRRRGAVRLAGRHVYLGELKGHFGHFLVESLARSWYLIGEPGARVIFHHRKQLKALKAGFWEATFAALGLDLDRVTFATEDLAVDELVVPSCQYWNRWKASPGFIQVFDHMRRSIAGKWNGARELPKKLYLTRRQYERTEFRLDAARSPNKLRGAYRRMISNEEVAEALFVARGFTVIAPETLPFEEQVMMIGGATHVAGPAGSALHMILFNANPEAKVITLNTRSFENQIWIETLRGVRGYHIACVKSRDENGVPAIDGPLVEQVLSQVL